MTTILTLALAVAFGMGDGDTRKSQEFPFTFGAVGLSTLMKEAALSDSQMKEFQGIFQSQRMALQQQRDAVEIKETALQGLLDAPQVDWNQVDRVLEEMLEARKALARTTTVMMVRMRQIVTQEQWRKIAELSQRQNPLPTPKPAPVPDRK